MATSSSCAGCRWSTTPTVYALGSVGDRRPGHRVGRRDRAGHVGVGALLLAGLGSLWLARTLARPLDELTGRLARMARERRFDEPLVPLGGSRELDALTETFDSLRHAIKAAEAEAETSYLGVIGSLAAALDARDRYTAGHSERVADLSVVVGRELGLSVGELDMLRLGALLHDIGKIGVPDAVLRKPGTLTDEEFAQIERHPTIGATILAPLRLQPEVLAIVELHHEQPDGRGYPHGLRGEQIPRFARHRARRRRVRRHHERARVPAGPPRGRRPRGTEEARRHRLRSRRHCAS